MASWRSGAWSSATPPFPFWLVPAVAVRTYVRAGRFTVRLHCQDFVVEDLPEFGRAVPVLVLPAVLLAPCCDWAGPTGRAPESAASAVPGAAARRLDAAGGVGPGFLGEPPNPGPNPRRLRRRAASPVPALFWRLSALRAPGRPGPGGRVGWAGGRFGSRRCVGAGLSWSGGRAGVVVGAGVLGCAVSGLRSVLGSRAVVAWLVRGRARSVRRCGGWRGGVSVRGVGVSLAWRRVSCVVAGRVGRVGAGVGGSGWVVSWAVCAWGVSVISSLGSSVAALRALLSAPCLLSASGAPVPLAPASVALLAALRPPAPPPPPPPVCAVSR